VCGRGRRRARARARLDAGRAPSGAQRLVGGKPGLCEVDLRGARGCAELRDGAVVDLARKEEHLSDDEFAQARLPRPLRPQSGAHLHSPRRSVREAPARSGERRRGVHGECRGPAVLRWALRLRMCTLTLASGRAQVFQADRGAFAALPQWRQAQAKRAAGLF
jgi:hypothetical protein